MWMSESFGILGSMEEEIKVWKVTSKIIPGQIYQNVNKIARALFHQIERKSKRSAYIRSRYFKKQKVFLSFFWDHLSSKKTQDKVRRLKYFECALEVIQNSCFNPQIRTNPNNKQEIFYRFYGQVSQNIFVVQIKKDKHNRLEFMSVFPK